MKMEVEREECEIECMKGERRWMMNGEWLVIPPFQWLSNAEYIDGDDSNQIGKFE